MTAPFPHWMSWLLDNPVRALFISPQTLADRIPIRSTDRVLEIGPGPGTFSLELARRIPEGHLELVDVQPEMLEKARRKLADALVRNVGFTVADAGNPLPLPRASFDVAVLVTVLGEVSDPGVALDSLHDVLKPNGVLAIHEHLPDPDIIPLEWLRRVVAARGFRELKVSGPRWNYTAIFRRDEDGT